MSVRAALALFPILLSCGKGASAPAAARSPGVMLRGQVVTGEGEPGDRPVPGARVTATGYTSVFGESRARKTPLGTIDSRKDGTFEFSLPEAFVKARADRATLGWSVSLVAADEEGTGPSVDVGRADDLEGIRIFLGTVQPGSALEVRKRLEEVRNSPLKRKFRHGIDGSEGYGEAQELFDWFVDAASGGRSARKVLKEYEKDRDENLRGLAYEVLAYKHDCEDDADRPPLAEDAPSARQVLEWSLRSVRTSRHGGHFALGVDLDDICPRCYGLWEDATYAAGILGSQPTRAYVATLEAPSGQPAIFRQLILESIPDDDLENSIAREWAAARPDFALPARSKLEGHEILFEKWPGVFLARPERDAAGMEFLPFWTQLREPDWSPDGLRIIGSGGLGRAGRDELWLLDLEAASGGRATWGGFTDSRPRWLADGRHVLHLRGKDLPGGRSGAEWSFCLLDTKTRQSRVLAPVGGYVSGYDVDRDGKRAVYAIGSPKGPTGIHILDLSTGTSEPLTPVAVSDGPAWSPDGRSVAFATEGSLEIIEISTRATRRAAKIFDWRVPFAWSPDGTGLAVVMNEGKSASPVRGRLTWVASVGGTPRILADLDRPLAWTAPAWSPDGRRVAFVARRGDAPWIHVVSRDGSNHLPVCAGGLLSDGAIRWRPAR